MEKLLARYNLAISNLSSKIICGLKIKIYTISGRLIKTIDNYAITDKYIKIFWDGSDQDGNRIANGTYFYKLTVSSLDDNFKTSKIGKLAIIR